MSRNDPKFPGRVMAIAVVLFGALLGIGWLIFGPEQPGESAAPQGAAGTAAASGAPQTPPAATASPAVQPAVVDPQTPGPVVDPAALDPTSPEALAALSAGRAEAGTMDIQLFLIVPRLERLIPVPRTVAAPATIDAQVRGAVQELIDWSGTEMLSPVAPESGIREVWVSRGGIAYIDFSRSFYDFSGGGSLSELHTVYGIVTTLTESFPEIFAVQFLIDGEPVESLAGHVDLSRPLTPSEDWVLIDRGERRTEGSGGGG